MRRLAALLTLIACLSLQAGGRDWPRTCGGGEKLFFNEQDIRAMREKIDRFPWAAEAYEELGRRATTPFPDSPYTKGIVMETMRLKEAALWYRIGGDESQIPAMVKGLQEHYDLDRPEQPFRPAKGSIPGNYWQRIMAYDLRYLAVYDLMKHHPQLQAYAAVMERRIREALAYTKYAVRHIPSETNTTFWTVTGLAAYGFYTGDREAIDMAINGKWGFKHVLGTFREGGRFRPEGASYAYRYVDNCLLIIAELARRNGWGEDLYRWEHPETGASLYKMARAMADLTQPGGAVNERGDHSEQADTRTGGWIPRGSSGWGLSDKYLFGHPEQHRMSDKAELYYAIYRDPEFAWLIGCGEGRRTHCDQFWGLLSLTHGVPETGEARAPEVRSEVLPHMGMGFLKSVENQDYWRSDALTATLVSGKKQLTHNHSDHFSFTLYAFGKYLYNDWFLYWDYLAPRKGRANMTPLSRRAIAHNTVCADFKEPSAKGAVRYSEIVRNDGAQILSVSGSVYEGIEQERTLCLTREYLIDVFELRSDQPHNYDYALHSRGSATYEGLRKWKDYPRLNEEYGFGPIDTLARRRPHNEWLLSPRSADCPGGAFSLRCSDTDGLSVRSVVFAGNGAQVFDTATPFYINLGGWDKPIPAGMPERNPMTVVRRKGKDACFVAVHQPMKGGTDPLEVKLEGTVLRIRSAAFSDSYSLTDKRYRRELR